MDATPGSAGGYRLGAGAALPPLLLDDDEAVAVAVGLRTAAGGTVTGIEETSVRALAKLEQVLPSRLRHRVAAVQASMVVLTGSGPTIDAAALAVIAGACRNAERLRFGYTDREGAVSRRWTEPHRLVHTGRRWYLGQLTALDDDTCLLPTGSDSLDSIALHVAWLGVEFEVLEPDTLADQVRALAERLGRAVGVSA